MSVIRLLITGGRSYADRARLERVLDAVHRKHAIETLIHGACHLGGADTLADEWARSRSIPIRAFPVIGVDGPWPGAGPTRNARMLKAGQPTHCIAFPGDSGTRNMVTLFNAYAGKEADAWIIQ